LGLVATPLRHIQEVLGRNKMDRIHYLDHHVRLQCRLILLLLTYTIIWISYILHHYLE